jgi:hypothetical protein
MITGALVTLGLVRSAASRPDARRVEAATGAATAVVVVAVLAALTLLPPGHVNL